MLRTLILAYTGAKSSNSLLYNKVLNISYNLLNTVLKVRSGRVVWVLDSCKTVVDLRGRGADWELQLTAGVQHHERERGSYRVSLAQEKLQIPNSKYSFY